MNNDNSLLEESINLAAIIANMSSDLKDRFYAKLSPVMKKEANRHNETKSEDLIELSPAFSKLRESLTIIDYNFNELARLMTLLEI